MKKQYGIILCSIAFLALLSHTKDMDHGVFSTMGISPQELLDYIQYACETRGLTYKKNDTQLEQIFKKSIKKPTNTRIIDMIERLITQVLTFTKNEYAIDFFKKNKITPISEEISSGNVSSWALKFNNLQQVTQQLINSLKGAPKKTIDNDYDLIWCRCFSFEPYDRIFFIVQLILDIEKNYPDKKNTLVYTSMASGGLLQDYLTVQELIRSGYTTIRVNIVDLNYPSKADLPATYKERVKKLSELKTQGKEKTQLAELIENSLRIENFESHIATLLSAEKLSNTTIAVRHFINEQGYLMLCEFGQALKSNVIVMVDPDRPALFNFNNGGSNSANALKISTPDTSAYVLMSAYHKPHIYSQKALNKTEKDLLTDVINQHIQKNVDVNPTTDIVEWLEKNGAKIPIKLLKTCSSAHSAFEDVVINASVPGAIAYLAADVQYEVNKKQKIKKIDTHTITQTDFINETIGKDMKEGFIDSETNKTVAYPYLFILAPK